MTAKPDTTKNYIVDTNVFLQNSRALFAFEENNVIITLGVIEQLDKFKKEQNELGRNARETVRLLDEMRSSGSLQKGVISENGGLIKVIEVESRENKGGDFVDWQMIDLAKKLKEECPNNPTIIVTRDMNLRLRADSLGIAAEEPFVGKVNLYEIRDGITDIPLTSEEINLFKNHGGVDVKHDGLTINQYLTLSNSKGKAALLARHVGNGKLVPLITLPGNCSIRPKNAEQHFAVDALMNDDIKLVSLIGFAGTGKTLFSILAGLTKVSSQNIYDNVIVYRPIIPVGKQELGFLPGDMDEKMAPWIQPVEDAIEFLGGKDPKRRNNYRRLIEVHPISYARGRNLHHKFIIVDEGQNLSPDDIKTIITRTGHDSKIILTGDIYQIDHPYLDSTSNGLSYAAEKLKNNKLCAHVFLEKGVRSELAELAAHEL